jgi:hypothetical protein
MKAQHAATTMRWLAISSLFWAAAVPLPAPAQTRNVSAANPVTLINAPTIIIDQNNNGTTIIGIRNNSPKDTTLELSAQDFFSTVASTPKPLGAQISFSKPEETPKHSVYSLGKFAANSTHFIQVEVNNVWESGESTADLQNNGRSIGALRALRHVVPFNVSLQAETPDNPKVTFRRGEPGALMLKNDDMMTYPIRWEVEIAGHDTSGFVLLPPKSTEKITVPAVPEWFSSVMSGLLKEEAQEARLMLRYFPSMAKIDSSWQVKMIPFKAQLHYFPPVEQQSLSIAVIFVILFLGGFCSLVVSYWVPNRIRSRELTEQLARLAAKTRGLSFQIDSSLRVLVRVERRCLQEMLMSRSALFSMDMTNIFNQVSRGLEILNKRLDFLEKIDTLYDQLNELMESSPPPSLMDRIEKSLQKATGLLKSSELQEADFQNIKIHITEAETGLGTLMQDDAPFAQELAERVKPLLDEFDETNGQIGTAKECKEIRIKLSEPFTALKTKWTDPKNIKPSDYAELDMNTIKLDLIGDYIKLLASSPELNKLDDKIEDKLLAHLRLQSWSELRLARQLVQQMREGIFAGDVQGEITKEQIEIVVDPGVARPYRPVQLKSLFYRRDLNAAAARNEITCEWNFRHEDIDLKETGWTISHYFPEEKEYEVKISFKDSSGRSINKDGQTEIMIAKAMNVKADPTVSYHDNFVTDAVRLSIVLFAALLALIAGAREQISKLDLIPGLIGVFILGFTADQIKNLLGQRPPGQ